MGQDLLVSNRVHANTLTHPLIFGYVICASREALACLVILELYFLKWSSYLSSELGIVTVDMLEARSSHSFNDFGILLSVCTNKGATVFLLRDMRESRSFRSSNDIGIVHCACASQEALVRPRISIYTTNGLRDTWMKSYFKCKNQTAIVSIYVRHNLNSSRFHYIYFYI